MPPHLPPYPSGGNGPPNAPGSRTHRPPIAHPWLHALWPTIAQAATARHISAPTQTSTWHIPLASSCGYLCEAPARDARHGGLGHRLPHLSIAKALSIPKYEPRARQQLSAESPAAPRQPRTYPCGGNAPPNAPEGRAHRPPTAHLRLHAPWLAVAWWWKRDLAVARSPNQRDTHVCTHPPCASAQYGGPDRTTARWGPDIPIFHRQKNLTSGHQIAGVWKEAPLTLRKVR